jgi:hypothetical protein
MRERREAEVHKDGQGGYQKHRQDLSEVSSGEQQRVDGRDGRVHYVGLERAQAEHESGPLRDPVAPFAAGGVPQQEIQGQQKEEAAQDLVVD